MRVLPTIVLVGLVAGGCAARLPVPDRADVARGAPSCQPAGTSVPEDRVTRILERASSTDVCFVRCALREGAERPEAEEEFLRHEVSIFLGYTLDRGDGGPTIGADYMYKLNESVGVGGFVDYVAGDLDALALGVGVWFSPIWSLEDLTFFAGPGIDVSNEEEEAHGGGEGGGSSWEVSPLIRLGVIYGFDLGRGFRLVPAFYFDVILPDKQAYVFGVNLAKEF